MEIAIYSRNTYFAKRNEKNFAWNLQLVTTSLNEASYAKHTLVFVLLIGYRGRFRYQLEGAYIRRTR